MNTNQVMLIDISGLAHQIFHVSGNKTNPSFISDTLIARVRAIASQHACAALCCDNGKSFRCDIDANYKANRNLDNRAVIKHQLDVALNVLRKDGFPVWAVKGYEADDVIASATHETLAIDGGEVLIVSNDKDLTQLISDRVTMRKYDGTIIDVAGVMAKFGVGPSQIADLLALMGDKSDNIRGADKIGAIIGAKLLSEHGSLAHLYEKMAKGVVQGVTPAMRTSLMEFKARWPLVASLIALRTDVPIPFAEVAAERVAAPMAEGGEMTGFIEEDAPQARLASPEAIPVTRADVLYGFGPKPPIQAETGPAAGTPAPPAGEVSVPVSPEVQSDGMGVKVAPRQPESSVLDPVGPTALAPVDFTMQLEPRTIDEAKTIAKHAFASRMFGAFGTPEAVFMTILAGRELGLTAMASLRAMHMIEGKPSLSADTMRALVLKSGLADYFRCTETTPERATFETQRKGEPEPTSLSFTMDEARQAGVVRPNSGWAKYPSDMLRARASAKLCRLVYPDVISGLYDPSEL